MYIQNFVSAISLLFMDYAFLKVNEVYLCFWCAGLPDLESTLMNVHLCGLKIFYAGTD